MSDLDQTFRISSISSNNMIYNVKDDPILQVSSQEPSTSSKSPNYPFSVKSCLILIKLSGYLSCHLTTWSIMLKMIPSSKSPVRNHQHPPSPKLTLSQPNHIWSWSNFYSSLINQQNFKAILQLSWACYSKLILSGGYQIRWLQVSHCSTGLP